MYTKLILIHDNVKDKDFILNNTLSDTLILPFNSEFNTKFKDYSITRVGLLFHNDNTITIDNLLSNIHYVQSIQKDITEIDLITCNGYKLASELESELNIKVNYSSLYIGYNRWFLDNNKVELEGLYFTENINEYTSHLGTPAYEWSEIKKLIATNRDNNDKYGNAVAVYGNTYAISAPGESSLGLQVQSAESSDNSASNLGGVYIYERDIANNFLFKHLIKPPYIQSTTALQFATQLALYDNTLAASSIYGQGGIGTVFIYRKNAQGIWEYKNTVNSPASTANDNFGCSLAINKIDNKLILAVGANSEDSSGVSVTSGLSSTMLSDASGQSGAVYIFREENENNKWDLESYIKPQEGSAPGTSSPHYFGQSLAMDNGIIAIGAPGSRVVTGGAASEGSVFVYRRNNNTNIWAYSQRVSHPYRNATAFANDMFGYSIGLKGNTLAISYKDDTDISGVLMSNEITTTIQTKFASDNNTYANSGAVLVYRNNTSTNQYGLEALLKADRNTMLPLSALNFGIDTGNPSDPFLRKLVDVDSNYIVVGCPAQNMPFAGLNIATTATPITNAGAVYLFKYENNVWIQDVYIKASDATASNFFGSTVAIQDSNVIVGAYGNTTINQGAAYVYSRKGTPSYNMDLTYMGYSKGFIGSGAEQYGTSVAIYGNYIAVGSANNSFNHSQTGDEFGEVITSSGGQQGNGAVYLRRVVYNNTNAYSILPGSSQGRDIFRNKWNKNSTENTTPTNTFGSIVDLHKFNNILILAVGAPRERQIFSGTYTPDIQESQFGTNAGDPLNCGSVYIYTYITNNSDSELGYPVCSAFLKPYISGNTFTDEKANAYFGSSLALYQNTIVVGSRGRDETISGSAKTSCGAVFIYKAQYKSGSTTSLQWRIFQKIIASDAQSNDQFGYSVAIYDKIIAIGAPYRNASRGAVYVYELNIAATSYEYKQTLTPSIADSNDLFGFSVTVYENTIAISAPGESSNSTTINSGKSDNSASNSGAVYVFTKNVSNQWVEESYIKAWNSGSNDYFGGFTLSLNNGNVLGNNTIKLHDNNTLIISTSSEDGATSTDINPIYANNNSFANTGAVYIYKKSTNNWQLSSYLKPPPEAQIGIGPLFGISISASKLNTTNEDIIIVGGLDKSIGVINNRPYGGPSSSFNIASSSGGVFAYKITDGLITTKPVTDIAYNSFKSGGIILEKGDGTELKYGIIWSTSDSPYVELPTKTETKNTITSGASIPEFDSTADIGILPNTPYYVRAYLTRTTGGITRTKYGNQIIFQSLLQFYTPTISLTITTKTINTINVIGNITNNGGKVIIRYGILWALNNELDPEYPSTNQVVDEGNRSGEYNKEISGLIGGTTYKIRAFAENAEGISYSSVIEVTTNPALTSPSVITYLPTEITNDSFKARGEILSNGNTTLTEYGFIYIKSPSLTTIELGTANVQKESFTTNILGAFNKTIQSLDPDSRYIYRAYATNSEGTSYGATQSLITSSFIIIGNPELITLIDSITTSTINTGGNIVSTGNIDIKEYGIIAHNSVTFDINTSGILKVFVSGKKIGIYDTQLTSLITDTTYYIKAYAINESDKIGYGQVITVTTDKVASDPQITTYITNITETSINGEGDITFNGNAEVIEYGYLYSQTEQAPTLETSGTTKVISGTTNIIGKYNFTQAGISSNTQYYIRVYVKNKDNFNVERIGYGNIIIFTTNTSFIDPQVLTDVNNYTSTTITTGGDIIFNGNGTITDYGIIITSNTALSTFILSDVNDTIIKKYQSSPLEANKLGKYQIIVPDLVSNTPYKIRAYIKAEKDGESPKYGYGAIIEITTAANLVASSPVVVTLISSIGDTELEAGGRITSNGNRPIIEYGIILSKITATNTKTNPTIDDVNGTTIIKLSTSNYDLLGTFIKAKNDLDLDTEYYVRAYAKNNGVSINPGYGDSIRFRTLPSLVQTIPELSTLAVSSISSTSFRCGGDITSRGNASIVEYGLIWGTTFTNIDNATLSLLLNSTSEENKYKVENNDIIGSYGASLTDKQSNTKYYIRAYAKNSVGIGYGAVIEVITLPLIVSGLPSITTTITEIFTDRVTGAVNILSNGNLAIEEYGFIWSKTSDIENPVLADTEGASPKAFNHKTIKDPAEAIVGTYSRTAQPLESNVLYSIVAYAKNSQGVSYGERYRLTTLSDIVATLPNILTTIATITSSSIVCGGEILSTGNAAIIEYGIVWIEVDDNAAIEPTISDNKITKTFNITGKYTETITGLVQNKTYNIRAYCKNAEINIIVYGNLKSITTSLSNALGDPTIQTLDISLITSSSFKSGGDIISNGNSEINEYGIIYSSDISKDPVLNNVTEFPIIVKKTVNTNNRQGIFTENILSGLISNKEYYVKAYAKNIAGRIGYGNRKDFTTLINIVKVIPVVSTSITQLTINSIVGGGTIISNGFDVIEEYGLIYSTPPIEIPDINNVIATPATAIKVPIIVTDKIQIGIFTTSIIGLSAGTIYNVRAYAKNSIGYGYGSAVTLVTTSALQIVRPSIKTEVSTVTATSILAGGSVLSNGNSIITQYGIIWAKREYLNGRGVSLEITNIVGAAEENAGQKILTGDIAASFFRELSPLVSGTEYEVRAYATNSVAGIGYGDILRITTNSTTEITIPSVDTNNIPQTDIKTNSIIASGNITSNGNQQIIEYGFRISSSANEQIVTLTGNYIGIFSKEISAQESGITLTSNTIYNIRAFAKNNTGLVNGNTISITTNPTLSTNAVSNLSSDAFTGSGFITSVGDGQITEYGIIWSQEAIPLYDLTTKIVKTTDIPNPINTPFSVTIPAGTLLSNVVYYYRVFAKNKDGIGYGNIVSLRTPVCPTPPIDPYLLNNSVPTNDTIEGESPEELTDKDILTTLYKKYKGYVNTNTDTDIAVEYQSYAQPISFANQIATQKVPVFGIPSTFTIDTYDEVQLKNTYAAELDTQTPNLVVNMDDNFNSTLFAGGTRNVWKDYCYLIYYSKIPLRSIPTNPGRSFNFYSQTLNMLTSIIPVNTAYISEANRYNIKIEKRISAVGLSPEKWVEIAPSNYILDRDAGVLTIYEKNSVVNGTNPPRISFWRYEGITLDNPGSILPQEIPPGALLFKSSGGAISGTQVFAVDTTSKTLQIDGNVNMTGVLDPLGVVLIPTEVHPLPDTDERYPTTMWYSNVTEQMYIGDRAIYTYDYDTLGPNFKGPTGPTGANGSGSGSGGGGGTYANDTWISGNFLDTPPAPTNSSADSTTININITWDNPNRIELAILPIKIPHITQMYITLDYTGNSGQPYEVLNTSDVSTLIRNLIIINASGTSARTNDTTYTWYKNENILTPPLTVKVWFTNHTTNTPKVLTISNLTFLTGGAPSKPLITLSGNTEVSSIIVQLKKGLYTDSSILNNAPSIVSYSVTYNAQSSKRKGGIYNSSHTNTVNVTSNIGTDSDYTTLATISSLYPGTTYSLNATTTNSFGLLSNFSDVLSNIETQLPLLGNLINNIDLPSYYTSQYLTGYINGIAYSQPIMFSESTWPSNSSTVDTLYISNNPIITQSKLLIYIKNTATNTDTNISNITYNSLLTLTPTQTVNNGADDIVVLSTTGNITDPYSAESSGFYWTAGFKSQIGANKLTAQSSKYILNFKQELYNSSGLLETIPNVNGRSLELFVDGLPLNTAPNIIDYTVSDNSTSQKVSGVSICSGSWSLSISNVQTQNVVRYFHSQKLLTFTFANSANRDLLTSFEGIGATSNTFFTTPTTITSISTDATYRYLPSISITANNINTTNNTFTKSKVLNMIIDNPSVTLLGQMSINPEPTGLLYGQLMSLSNASDIIVGNEISNFRNSYDHNITLTTTSGVDGYNSLQLVNGKFMTRAFTGTGSAGAYKDYSLISSGSNYLSLASETRYRWVAFRWRRTVGQIKSLSFKIEGIEGTDATLLKDPTTSKVLTASGKEIKFYYRTEDQSKNSGNPSDLEDTQNAQGGSISTVWINANKIDENQFAQYAGKLNFSGLIGGITSSSKITLTPGNIQYDVISYNFNLGSTPVYIYGLIGLPMDSNIAFKGIKCTVTVV